MLIYSTKTRHQVPAASWPKEKHLDAFLVEHPDLLGLLLEPHAESDAARRSLIPLAATSLGGQFDCIDVLLLYIPTTGGGPRLVLCENKRATNSELQNRSAMGQLLEYAGRLQQMTTSAFQRRLADRLANPVWQARFADLRSQSGVECDTASVLEAACDAHAAGRLLLLVCADEFPRPFVDTIRWLNTRLREVQIEGVDITPLGAPEGLVRAAALAVLMTGREAEGLQQRDKLDCELEGIVRLFTQGDVVPSFIRLWPVDDGHVAAALGMDAESVLSEAEAKAGGKISVGQWEARANATMRTLANRLRETLSARWTLSTRSSFLVLELDGNPNGILRLQDAALAFAFGRVNQSPPAVRAWCFGTAVELGAEVDGRKQPLVRGSALSDLAGHRFGELVAFLEALAERLDTGG